MLLGLTTKESRPPRQWREAKSLLLKRANNIPILEAVVNAEVKRKSDKRSCKRIKATAYIKQLGGKYGDTCPTNRTIHILPHETQEQLFEEYNAYCDCNNINITLRAGKSTFFHAFQDCKSHIRLSGCKGI